MERGKGRTSARARESGRRLGKTGALFFSLTRTARRGRCRLRHHGNLLGGTATGSQGEARGEEDQGRLHGARRSAAARGGL